MRLIDDPAGRGAWNMALDEALLDQLTAGQSSPALRFYGWDPPTLSLGYSQPLGDVDFAACERLGVDVVRRPTGGRAVLHVAELTYSVTAPAGHESVARSYCRISTAIARAIGRLGVQASLEPGSKSLQPSVGRDNPAAATICADQEGAFGGASPGAAGILPAPRGPTNRSADCFATSTSADLVAAGRKIAGSAQVRRRGNLLQHGSIKLAPPPIAIGEVLRSAPKASAPAFPAATPFATLAELLDTSAEAILDPLKRLIADELGVPWLPTVPTAAELALARAIEARSSSSLRRPDTSAPLLRATD